MQLTVWMVPATLGVLMSLLAGVLTWNRRTAPGARALLLLCFTAGWWCLLQVVSLGVHTLDAKILAAKLQYLGVALAPFAWFLFAVSYTGLRRWQRPARLALVLAPELLTLVLAWTNEAHGLMWDRLWVQEGTGYTRLGVEHGPWFRIRLLYAYGLVIAASAIAAFHFAHQPHHRRRLVAVLLAPLPVLLLNLVYVAGLQAPGTIDLTPTGFALGGLLLTWAVYRHELLDLPPVSRSSILDLVPAGVVVLDGRERILDVNEAARAVVRVPPGSILPAALREAVHGLAPGQPRLVEQEGATYEVTTSAVGGSGSLVVLLHEVTERLRLEQELRELSFELSRANQELHSLANTDELTALPNRRYFMEALTREVERTSRYRHPLSLVLLDVDDFKRINDLFGHPGGDSALAQLSAILLATIRVTDLAGRLGGDEFGLLFPDTPSEGAVTLLERLRERIATAELVDGHGRILPLTVSIGVASVSGPTRAEELLQRADDALYRAKAGGRNQVQVAGAE